MAPIDDLAALLPGRLARRRAQVLVRRWIDVPPASIGQIAAELGVSVYTVDNDLRVALDQMRRLGRRRDVLAAIPRGTRLYDAVLGAGLAAEAERGTEMQAALRQARSLLRSRPGRA